MRWVPVLACALSFVACRGGSATAPSRLAGAYTLRTVNGAALPYTVSQDTGSRVELTAGILSLGTVDAFYIGISRVLSRAGQPSEHETQATRGTYVLMGDQLAVTTDEGRRYALTTSGNTITHLDGDLRLVFQR